ncbi:serine dehydratase beta chain-domain-containing protein [Phakopsora pachyrhizi]|uniref:Serine dehydratase beta chain-domain-containing protein n=1 Tax=Phakopsora pachyrhizi TaxID=170000 RepID=A0AAV0AQ15_PHAPC|nr:serine dehydratase beta chain-domain-containing protein [Phakopsora pachyrhizi]
MDFLPIYKKYKIEDQAVVEDLKGSGKYLHAVVSTFDIFLIGIVPSSSHMVGPMRAAKFFASDLKRAGALGKVKCLKVALCKGHMSPKALIAGLEGHGCKTVETHLIPRIYKSVVESKSINLEIELDKYGKGHSAFFDIEKDMVMDDSIKQDACSERETLPGRLGVKRKARNLYQRLHRGFFPPLSNVSSKQPPSLLFTKPNLLSSGQTNYLINLNDINENLTRDLNVTIQNCGQFRSPLILSLSIKNNFEPLKSEAENWKPSLSQLLVHLYGGHKVARDFFQNICPSAILLDSPHTALLQKGKTLPEQPSHGSVFTALGTLMGAANTSLDRMAGIDSLTGAGYILTYPPISGGRPSASLDKICGTSLVDVGFPRLMTPKAQEKLSPILGPNPFVPDKIRARIMTALGELRDPIWSHFLKQSMESTCLYEGLAWDIKAAFKAFKNNLCISFDNKAFDSILSLMIKLQELLQNVRASLQRNTGALFEVIIKLLQDGSIPSRLALALLVAEAILVHRKNKPAFEIPNAQLTPKNSEENVVDVSDKKHNITDEPMGLKNSNGTNLFQMLVQATNMAAVSGFKPSDSNIFLISEILTSAVVLTASPLTALKIDKGNKQQVKSKHEIPNFMLCDLISTGLLSQPNKTKSQKKSAIESWAIMVLFALRNVPNAGKKPSETVTFVRPYVLGSLARANQDAVVSEEPFDARYGCVYALLDLTFCPTPLGKSKRCPMQIAKIMLEKNFAAMLSNALANVDLNFQS